jgi:DeoR family glycerol-3-phosphate regulon repressor
MKPDTTVPQLNARQNEILIRVEASGFVTIESLAEEFSVSAQTVRRDIIFLSDAGLLQRFHGGAGVIGNT